MNASAETPDPGQGFALVRGAAEFNMWLQSAPPGARAVYHCGFIMAERKGDDGKPTMIAEIAMAAFLAYVRGEVHLFQRRLATAAFEYVAVRRSAPESRPGDRRPAPAPSAAGRPARAGMAWIDQ